MHWLATNYQWLVAVVLMPIILLLLRRWAASRTAPPQTDEPAGVADGREGQDSEKGEVKEEETAKVDFIQSRIVQLHESGYAIWCEAVSNLQSARPAVVAEFKNKPKAEVGQRTVKAGSVTASLVYRGKGNPEELHVSHGTWLDEYTHFASFPSGKTHNLIIGVKLVPFVAMGNPRSRDPRRRFISGQTIHHAQPVVLPAREGELEITLVDGWGVTVYHGLFDYDFSSANTASLKVK